MFYVINKEKIIAYVVTVFTIVVLYFVASTYEYKDVVPTSNIVVNNISENSIKQ
ncbi:unknown [Clostridium sp. CAG:354]|jgi:hypothetical protein|nr:hypothetical protein [Clostridium sp.]MBS5864143.1 hypothetical protein [Clostridium sp.]MEE0268927.1 hypothetical protein [Clostridia bacterium]CDE09852.1 unknown [Clostridium sp. CAG:354]